jgi:hypothetical protein
MAHPEMLRPKDAAKRFGVTLRTLARRVADESHLRTDAVTGASRERLMDLLRRIGIAPAAPEATPSQPVIPLINLRRSLGRAAVACENQHECGGTIELALYEHTVSTQGVGEATVLEATMINQTCNCDLSDDDRENVIDRVQHEIRMHRGSPNQQGVGPT